MNILYRSWLDQFLEHFKKSDLVDEDGLPCIAVLGNKADLASEEKVQNTFELYSLWV